MTHGRPPLRPSGNRQPAELCTALASTRLLAVAWDLWRFAPEATNARSAVNSMFNMSGWRPPATFCVFPITPTCLGRRPGSVDPCSYCVETSRTCEIRTRRPIRPNLRPPMSWRSASVTMDTHATARALSSLAQPRLARMPCATMTLSARRTCSRACALTHTHNNKSYRFYRVGATSSDIW